MYNIEFTCRPDRSHARTVLRTIPTVPGASQADKCNDLLDAQPYPGMTRPRSPKPRSRRPDRYLIHSILNYPICYQPGRHWLWNVQRYQRYPCATICLVYQVQTHLIPAAAFFLFFILSTSRAYSIRIYLIPITIFLSRKMSV
jgi:hypothetical protein